MSNKIFQLIPKIMGDIGAIGKSGLNTFDNYKFRSVDDVYNKVQPVLVKHGVFFKPTVLESSETKVQSQAGKDQVRVKMRVEYTFFADDGSNFATIVEGEAIDRSDKATNKAMTACLKYMLIQVFCIAIAGASDADSGSPSAYPDDQKARDLKEIRSLLKDIKKDEPAFLGYLPQMLQRDIESLDSLEKVESSQVLAFLKQLKADNKPQKKVVKNEVA